MNNTGTVLGKGICIRGEITGSEDLFLDGMIEGTITLADNRLTVGPNGLAQAEITTGDLVVFGRVEGSVKASVRAELKRNSSFIGDIVASRLSIEEGATMQGYVDLTQEIPAKKPALPELVAPLEEQVEQFSEAV
ncbi:MAG TPA: polymer-forming cytoskeletal protein [Acidobacteriaceae bacterium]|nr:polymer-forming cytoskeletal protein [Acidobacteriaceae bacterium]